MKGAAGLLASPIPKPLFESIGSDENAVVMVDVGGGVGQVTEKTLEENPQVKGRFVVQDLGAIIEEARAKNPNYEVMEYDFFTPQPVKGISNLPLWPLPMYLPSGSTMGSSTISDFC